MNNWSEGKALLAAICVSGVAVLGVFATASIVRNGIPVSIPTFAIGAQAAIKTSQLTADAAQGRHLFLMNCAHCHGDDARGAEGPDLHNLHKSDARIHLVVTEGIKGEMPSFGKKLNDADIRALTAYLRTLRG